MAKNAHGTQIKWGDGGDPESFTTVNNVLDISGFGKVVDFKETTSHSTTGAKEHTPVGLPDINNPSFSIEYDPADTTHQQIRTDQNNNTKRNIQKVIRPGEADEETHQVSVYVANIQENEPVSGTLTWDIELQTTGDDSVT